MRYLTGERHAIVTLFLTYTGVVLGYQVTPVILRWIYFAALLKLK